MLFFNFSKPKFYFFFLIFFSCLCETRIARSNSYQLDYPVIPFNEFIKQEDYLKQISGRERANPISSLILHHTDNKSKEEYIKESLSSGFMVHFIVGRDAKYYGWNRNPYLALKAVPKMDDFSLHISIEGTEDSILLNKQQLAATGKLLKKISTDLDIPFSNQNINSKAGVFTHIQAKKKFGNFVDLKECGSEKILKEIFSSYGGSYFSEENWEGRFERDWILRREKKNKEIPEPDFDRGRGITQQTKVELKELEKDEQGFTPENFRLKYVFKQKIKPECIVLHYTAIPSFAASQETLERRKLMASIMVDKDGKAYQLLDALDDMAQAATGTNQNCIQIEIVGRNMEELLANERQTQKVTRLVKELADTFNVPLNNHKIEDLKGIYSHTQAKKKYGGSIALYGKDFDPGEPYMKKIIESIGGNYFPEKDWYERKSDDWIMLEADFQP
jgi:N-acetylmuramoyl-L-alanine amidase